jgi:DHA2 family lincomycin resistance protein-like MFS transporter
MAMAMTPLMTVALGSLPREQYGHGSAIMNTLQQVAGAGGTAIMIAVMTIGTTAAAATGAAENLALVNGILGLVAILCAPFVTRIKQDPNN